MSVTYETFEAVQHNDVTVHRMLREGRDLREIITALANEKLQLRHEVMELASIAPKKITVHGQTFIWRCPDELIPERL